MKKPATKAEVRRVVAQIRSILVRGGGNAPLLWAVLAGIRGPDEDDSSSTTKECTMAVIRHRLFGPIGGSWGMVNPDTNKLKKRREGLITEHLGDHFWEHVADAFSALDELGFKK
jgi:hypothetical protein